MSPEFKQLSTDPILLRLENPRIEPGFADTRHCLVFWARPPEHILKLASHVQALLQRAAPSRLSPAPIPSPQERASAGGPLTLGRPLDLWLMPPHRMHLTTLEIAHSRTAEEIADLVARMRPAIPALTGLPATRRARLVKPLLSYDLSAIALSFLPAAGEEVLSPPPVQPPPEGVAQSSGGPGESTAEGDRYTYHHLRRDAYRIASETGVPIASRYVVPSAHITLGRYLTQQDHETPEQRERWIRAVEDINTWLEAEVWDARDGEFIGEWIVGQEKGLDARCGALWYGGGRTIMVGEGF